MTNIQYTQQMRYIIYCYRKTRNSGVGKMISIPHNNNNMYMYAHYHRVDSHSHGAVVRPSARQRRLRVTRCIYDQFFFSFRFFLFSRTQYTNLYYIIILCIHIRVFCVHHIIRSRCSFTFRSFSSHSVRNNLLYTYYIGIGKYAYIAIIYYCALVSANVRFACVCARV